MTRRARSRCTPSATAGPVRRFRLGRPAITERGSDGLDVSVPVRNTGRRRGAQVVQVYVRDPIAAGEPPHQLKAFARVELEPGQRRTAKLQLDRSAFEIWDSGTASWTVPGGRYRIAVGTSSRALPYVRSVRR